MKRSLKSCLFTMVLSLLLCMMALGGVAQEIALDEELPEGVYIYTPAADRFLPWTPVDDRNVFQVIGLAPHDTTVNLNVSMDGEPVWSGETMSEGNGYFYAEIPVEVLDVEPDYQLTVKSGAYVAETPFFTYNGTVAEFAADPLHLALLEDLTDEERAVYESEMNEETIEDEAGEAGQEKVALEPNEFRNEEYTYILESDNTVTLTVYHKHERDLVLPEIVDGYPVTGIQFELFNRASGVRTVTIPNRIVSLRYNGNPFLMWKDLTAIYVAPDHPAFSSVNGILYSKDLSTLLALPRKHPEKEAVIPDGTRSIGIDACYYGTIRKAVFPDSLRELDSYALAYNFYLKKLELTDGIRVLKIGCLKNTAITSLMIPSKASANTSFASACPNLQEITVMPGNETVKSIDGVLFSADGETLITYPAARPGKKYTTPGKTVVIGEEAFSMARNLESVVLTEKVSEIQGRAFDQCSFKSIKLPNSVTTMNENVFTGCYNLEEFIINKNHPTLSAVDKKYLYSKDHTIFYCYPGGLGDESDVLEKYVLEKETKKIQPYAFEQTKIRNVVLPEGLEEIGDRAFFGAGIITLYVPESVKRIGVQAFSQSNVIFAGLSEGVETLGWAAFRGCIALSYIAVPESVSEIGQSAFLDIGEGRVITKENSYMHQYAVQNMIKVDVAEGKYDEYMDRILDFFDVKQDGEQAQRIKIKSSSRVNIRQKPDGDSRRLGFAQPGDEYDVTEIIRGNGDQIKWFKVKLEDGNEGYISASVAELLE